MSCVALINAGAIEEGAEYLRWREAQPDQAAMPQLPMNARVFHRVPELTRTIADLAGPERIEKKNGKAGVTPTDSRSH